MWAIAVLASSKLLFDYKGRAAPEAAATAQWPTASAIARASDRPTLLMFVHPRCPCTRASISELARLSAQLGDRVRLSALVVVPPGAAPGFDAGASLDRLRAIPGIQITTDEDGREARRFGVATSGHVLFYDRAGALRYSGGITPGRGHEGQSIGQHSILALVAGWGEVHAQGPVFGCALFDPNSSSNSRRETSP